MVANSARWWAIGGIVFLCCTAPGYHASLAAREKADPAKLQPVPDGSVDALPAEPLPSLDHDSPLPSSPRADHRGNTGYATGAPSGSGDGDFRQGTYGRSGCGEGCGQSGYGQNSCGQGGCGHSDCGENSCWGGCCQCGSSDRLWVQTDYMMWWEKGVRIQPLLTTSPADTAKADAGVPGLDSTTVLFGDRRVDGGTRSGFRVSGGYWINCCQTVALVGDYFDSGGQSTDFFASGNSAGNPIIARPFVNVSTGNAVPSSQFVSFPGLVTGSVNVHTDDYFQSAGASLRQHTLLGIVRRRWRRRPLLSAGLFRRLSLLPP